MFWLFQEIRKNCLGKLDIRSYRLKRTHAYLAIRIKHRTDGALSAQPILVFQGANKYRISKIDISR